MNKLYYQAFQHLCLVHQYLFPLLLLHPSWSHSLYPGNHQ